MYSHTSIPGTSQTLTTTVVAPGTRYPGVTQVTAQHLVYSTCWVPYHTYVRTQLRDYGTHSPVNRNRSLMTKKRAMAKNGSSRSFLGQKRVGRIMKAANTQFGLTFLAIAQKKNTAVLLILLILLIPLLFCFTHTSERL